MKLKKIAFHGSFSHFPLLDMHEVVGETILPNSFFFKNSSSSPRKLLVKLEWWSWAVPNEAFTCDVVCKGSSRMQGDLSVNISWSKLSGFMRKLNLFIGFELHPRQQQSWEREHLSANPSSKPNMPGVCYPISTTASKHPGLLSVPSSSSSLLLIIHSFISGAE